MYVLFFGEIPELDPSSGAVCAVLFEDDLCLMSVMKIKERLIFKSAFQYTVERSRILSN